MMAIATKLNMAALIRPIWSPKFSSPAASAESVTVKESHERTVWKGKRAEGEVSVLFRACFGRKLREVLKESSSMYAAGRQM